MPGQEGFRWNIYDSPGASFSRALPPSPPPGTIYYHGAIYNIIFIRPYRKDACARSRESDKFRRVGFDPVIPCACERFHGKIKRHRTRIHAVYRYVYTAPCHLVDVEDNITLHDIRLFSTRRRFGVTRDVGLYRHGRCSSARYYDVSYSFVRTQSYVFPVFNRIPLITTFRETPRTSFSRSATGPSLVIVV